LYNKKESPEPTKGSDFQGHDRIRDRHYKYTKLVNFVKFSLSTPENCRFILFLTLALPNPESLRSRDYGYPDTLYEIIKSLFYFN